MLQGVGTPRELKTGAGVTLAAFIWLQIALLLLEKAQGKQSMEFTSPNSGPGKQLWSLASLPKNRRLHHGLLGVYDADQRSLLKSHVTVRGRAPDVVCNLESAKCPQRFVRWQKAGASSTSLNLSLTLLMSSRDHTRGIDQASAFGNVIPSLGPIPVAVNWFSWVPATGSPKPHSRHNK